MSSRRSFRGKPKKSKSAVSNPNAMMAQVQRMQEEMALAQQALEHEYVEVTAGGGAIAITISGHQRVKSITINPDLIDPEDPDMLEDLQDLLVAAINSAVEQSQVMAAERMESISGGMGMNDLLGGLM
ncbi:MAG: YbaB/EbfC family nucleoid-associated protein [Anaerolineae bacterium]|nr:YbaB/EbfC family nucleoid-associated protein [Anaerolineae bacterium]MCO5193288.1 YbaB/EbfC family nucleoid-associated protein [Anaerolineae bacterium]MCO5196155.1 YbaB/EbfC family nucleoid-associated protein [Anaerolineae bacterium]